MWASAQALRTQDSRHFGRVLVPLVLPLLDGQGVARWLAQPDALDRAAQHDLPHALWLALEDDEAREVQQRFEAALKHLPARLLQRLAAVDDAAPLNPTIRLICDGRYLGPTEQRLLDYLACFVDSEPLRLLLRACETTGSRVNRSRLAALLGVPEGALQAAFSPTAPLLVLG
ncbi:MAG: hypothetical protein EA400_14895 [Chromatiaceae bacterium]|nr:MAG: hypothetical protein EA400_14895 [Chromatiaceae bacterium]